MEFVFESADTAGEIRRLDALVLHFELTARVLAMKRARDADGAHAWPPSIPGGEASSCPGVRFLLTEPAPGVVRIEAESWEGTWWVTPDQRNVLPLAWQSNAVDTQR